MAWLTPLRVRLYGGGLAAAVWVTWVASQAAGEGLLDHAGRIAGTDFVAFYTAGRFVGSGRGAELYDFDAQTAFQDSLGARAERPILFPYVNPPYAALLYAPYARLGYMAAYAAWLATGLACLTVALWLLRRELGAGGHSLRRWLLAALAFFPTIVWAMHGQNSPLSLLLLAGAFVALRRRRDGIAGAVLGCLAYKPQLALGAVVALAAARRWRTLAAAAAVGAGLVVVSSLVLPEATAAYRQFAPHLPEYLRASPKAWGIHSLFGATFLAFDGWWPAATAPVAALLTVMALAMVARAWWGRPWTPGTASWDLRWAATLVAGLLVSGHLFTYDLMLLLAPLAIVWARARKPGAGADMDAGPELGAVAALYVAVVASSYLSQGQLAAVGRLGLRGDVAYLPAVALQVSTVAMVAWALRLRRLAEDGG